MPIQVHSTVYRETLELLELAHSLLADVAAGCPPPADDCREVAYRLRKQADFLLELEEKAYRSQNRPPFGQEG